MIFLTVINSIILAFNMAHSHSVAAEGVPAVLRGHALEIVDEHNKVRAEIIVTPDSMTAAGQKSSGGVLLRFINDNGKPVIKIVGSVDGSAASFDADPKQSEWTGTQILSKPTGTMLKLTNKDGHVQIVQPSQ